MPDISPSQRNKIDWFKRQILEFYFGDPEDLWNNEVVQSPEEADLLAQAALEIDPSFDTTEAIEEIKELLEQ